MGANRAISGHSKSDLIQAIKNNELELYYQPQYDFLLDAFMAVEVLVRWNHPTVGLIEPLDFMLLANEYDISILVGEWILEETCRQISIWQSLGLPLIRVAVNITSQQLQDENFICFVQQILDSAEYIVTYLELEIAEDVLLDDSVMIQKIQQLKNFGFKIALDDFGSGYANLAHLPKLSIDRIKIDKMCIHNLEQDAEQQMAIRQMIRVSNELGLRILVEGVETEWQKNFLLAEKCHEAQGFYFSYPLRSEDMVAFFRRQK